MNTAARMRHLPWIPCAALLALVLALPTPSSAQQFSPDLMSGLQWRPIGPFRGGRTIAVAGVPSQPNVFYSGAVDGGVWKTINAGTTWSPIFDDEPIASIGAIAVAPSNPNVIYVGTGEADPRSQISYGDGIYKSVDAGKTWTHIGLDDSLHIGHIIVDPANPDRLFVAVLGNLYAASAERGVYRSTDGGKTWGKVLYKDQNIGAIDVTFDPGNSKVVYASLWSTRRPPWAVYPSSNGPGGGVYKSTDGGTTWTQLGNGLPTVGVGKIGLAVAPTDANRVYAIIDAKQGGLYRSDDAGASWKLVDGEARIWGRGWYFDRITVDPKNKDKLYVMNTSTYRSTDGGKSFDAIKGSAGGDDYHRLWINPNDPQRMVLSSDQGTIVSVDGAQSWNSWNNQPTGQFYHISADNRDPFWLYAAQQDSGPKAIASDVSEGRITHAYWTRTCTGGESDYIATDPLSTADIYSTTVLYDLYDNTLTGCNQLTGIRKIVTPWAAYPGEVFRHTWTLPVVFSMADKHALYFSNQFLFKTTDGGQNWQRISPDLSREKPGIPSNLDPATAADVSYSQQTDGPRWGVIYSIAPSPLLADTIWTGTDDGLIWVTGDGGKHWKNVTPPSVTAWSKVIMLDASHFDAGTAYAAIDRHRLNDYSPHALRTRDGGKTWQEVDSGLPHNAYVMSIKQDPGRKDLVFAGTSTGVYVSFNGGDQWQSLRLNMPVVEIRDFVFHDNSVAIATFGRGLWILDDLNPLHQLDATIAGADTYLFAPETAVLRAGNGKPRVSDTLQSATNMVPFEVNSGDPRIKGAILDYYLKSAASGPVKLEILDADGHVIRGYSNADKFPQEDPRSLNMPAAWVMTPAALPTTAGMHRFSWDLYTGATHAGAPSTNPGHKVLPGQYTVRLTADGKSATRPLLVKLDAGIQYTLPALSAQSGMIEQIDALQTRIHSAQDEVVQLRRQLASLSAKASGKSGIATSIAALDKKAKEIAGYAPPPNPDTTGVGDAAPTNASLKGLDNVLTGMSHTTQEGMGAPTPATLTGFDKVRQTAVATLANWSQLETQDVAQLNTKLSQANLPTIQP